MHGQQEEFCIANTKLLAFQSHLKCREEEERRIEDERRREQLDSGINELIVMNLRNKRNLWE